MCENTKKTLGAYVTKDMATLQAVVTQSNQVRTEGPRIRARALAQAAVELASLVEAQERAVVAALRDGHTVTEVARAMTTPGKTPNRNKVYEIKKKYEGVIDSRVGGYPFEWVSRTIETATGTRTVYDVHALVQDFGPEGVTGDYTWRYDLESERLEPVFSLDYEPWPTTRYYQSLLTQWVEINPYPGASE